MPLLGFTEAARLAGVDVSTIHRKVRRGEISATRQPNGRRVIDLAELLRAYPDLAEAAGTPPGAASGPPGSTHAPAAAHASDATVELLERELAAARDREARLLPPPRRGWLARLLGR